MCPCVPIPIHKLRSFCKPMSRSLAPLVYLMSTLCHLGKSMQRGVPLGPSAECHTHPFGFSMNFLNRLGHGPTLNTYSI